MDERQSTIPLLHSAFRIPKSAITLTEVLISMGILTLGLLGVMAMFPVGGYYMQQGEVADRASAIAQAAFNDAVSRGMLNPQNWFIAIPKGNGTSASSPLYNFPAESGFLDSMYSRNIAATLAESIGLGNENPVLSRQFGDAFMLDPMGTASIVLISDSWNNLTGAQFPANADSTTAGRYYSDFWDPWEGPFGSVTWPIHRVTFHQPNGGATTTPMRAAMAEQLFSSQDDLAMDMPDRDDLPSTQNWDTLDTDSDGQADLALARQSRGDYSWIITVVPKTPEARNALASGGGGGHEYDVSVVVFYKRVVPRTDPRDAASPNDASIDAGETLLNEERLTRARVVSTGLSGGELLLEQWDNLSAFSTLPSPFERLKVGQWVLVGGPHPNSDDNNPRFVVQWYRVLSIEGKNTRLNDQGTDNPPPPTNDPERRLVSLRGPKWPWEPSPSGLAAGGELANNLCVCLMPGAVAVHNKTIRVESDSAFGGIGGGGGVAPTNSPWLGR